MRFWLLRSFTLLTLIALVSSGVFAQRSATAEYPVVSADVWQIELLGNDGSAVRLEALKGKAILLHLWGTWLGPYHPQIVTYNALTKKYPELKIIGMNIGDIEGKKESISSIRRFVKNLKISYPVARISNDATKSFYDLSKMQVVPQAFLIDRQGRLRGIFVGGGERADALMKAGIEAMLVDDDKH